MIISEKQIMNLLSVAHNYRHELLLQKSKTSLTKAGEDFLGNICELINEISRQQSQELKVIE